MNRNFTNTGRTPTTILCSKTPLSSRCLKSLMEISSLGKLKLPRTRYVKKTSCITFFCTFLYFVFLISFYVVLTSFMVRFMYVSTSCEIVTYLILISFKLMGKFVSDFAYSFTFENIFQTCFIIIFFSSTYSFTTKNRGNASSITSSMWTGRTLMYLIVEAIQTYVHWCKLLKNHNRIWAMVLSSFTKGKLTVSYKTNIYLG